MTELLACLVGAAIALFSYSMGRNNKAPMPPITVPFTAKPENGKTDRKPEATIPRGM